MAELFSIAGYIKERIMKISINLQVKNTLYELCLKHTAFTNHFINRMGLYQGQPRLLMLLWEQDGLTQSAIVETLELSQPTVAKTIDRLEKKGILSTRPDSEDKRIVRVFLTPKGRSLQDEVMLSFENMAEQLLAGFAREEKDQMIDTMKRLQNNITSIGDKK